MPAVKYNYDYYDQYGKSGKGVAKSARPSQSSLSAGRKVASNSIARRSTTPESTRNSTRIATRTVATSTSTAKRNSAQTKKKTKVDIDIPVIVKKKIEIQKPQEMKLNKPKQEPKLKSKAKAKVEGTKRKILFSTLVVLGLFMICIRYTQINEKFNEVTSLEKSLNSTKALNQQLSTDIESKTDLSYIEKYAKYQLGMQKPSDSQIVRIAYEKHDKISTPVIIEEVEENTFLENLLNDLKNLID